MTVVKRNIIILIVSLVTFLFSFAWADNAEVKADNPAFNLEVKDNLINLRAEQASFKDILTDLEKKTNIKVKIFEGVEDKNVSLNIIDLPVYAIHDLLEKIELENYAVAYDQELASKVIYILPKGADIAEILKGKTIIKPVSLSNSKQEKEWLKALKNFSPPERIKISRSVNEIKKDENLRKTGVLIGETPFTLDTKFVPAIKGEQGHILIQFDRVLDDSMRKELKELGVELLSYIPFNAWKVKIPSKSVQKVKTLDYVYAMDNIHPFDKFPIHVPKKDFSLYSYNEDETITLQVSFVADVPFKRVKEIITELSGKTQQVDFISGHRVVLTIPQVSILSLAEYDEVSWIEEKPGLPQDSNLIASVLSKVDDVQTAPYNLNGTDIRIGQWEKGNPWSDHRDLSGRITIVDGLLSLTTGHATHVATTMIGTGEGDAWAEGMATASTIYSYNFWGDEGSEMKSAISQYGIIVANHSWSNTAGWNCLNGEPANCNDWEWWGDSNFGAYTSETESFDETVYSSNLIIVKSAGNDRADIGPGNGNDHKHAGVPIIVFNGCNHSSDDHYNSIPDIGTAKNIITVGAIDSNGAMAQFSSWGPTNDGRIKPDLVAFGRGLYSAWKANEVCPDGDQSGEIGYCHSSGTSMSAPVVTGVIALINQQYKMTFSSYPRPDVIRAILINTTFNGKCSGSDIFCQNDSECSNDKICIKKGPDFEYGWGLLDAKAAVDVVRDCGSECLKSASVSDGEIKEYTTTVDSNTPEFKVIIAWTDPPGDTSVPLMNLVNDIDLELIGPDGTTHYPWVLLDLTDPSQSATTGINRVDNVEQVLVNNPQPGLWTVRVKGYHIPQGPQSYALVSNLHIPQIAGKLIDPETSNPIPSATVRLFKSNEYTGGGILTNTDSNGNFMYFGVNPGSYRIEITKSGYNSIIISGISVSEFTQTNLNNNYMTKVYSSNKQWIVDSSDSTYTIYKVVNSSPVIAAGQLSYGDQNIQSLYIVDGNGNTISDAALIEEQVIKLQSAQKFLAMDFSSGSGRGIRDADITLSMHTDKSGNKYNLYVPTAASTEWLDKFIFNGTVINNLSSVTGLNDLEHRKLMYRDVILDILLQPDMFYKLNGSSQAIEDEILRKLLAMYVSDQNLRSLIYKGEAGVTIYNQMSALINILDDASSQAPPAWWSFGQAAWTNIFIKTKNLLTKWPDQGQIDAAVLKCIFLQSISLYAVVEDRINALTMLVNGSTNLDTAFYSGFNMAKSKMQEMRTDYFSFLENTFKNNTANDLTIYSIESKIEKYMLSNNKYDIARVVLPNYISWDNYSRLYQSIYWAQSACIAATLQRAILEDSRLASLRSLQSTLKVNSFSDNDIDHALIMLNMHFYLAHYYYSYYYPSIYYSYKVKIETNTETLKNSYSVFPWSIPGQFIWMSSFKYGDIGIWYSNNTQDLASYSDVLKGHLDTNKVSYINTSFPYYLTRRAQYDNEASGIEYVWLLNHAGACYEFDSNCDGCIGEAELTTVVNRWLVNSSDVTMTELIGAILRWKSKAGLCHL
ncbi:MAG: hypothetical protein C4581_12360 [Nitrospiraceae bacterium]|nr:MAG: hypothetical protein C4581_12360 [Nitrospiraceae bacterium]